MTRTEFHARQLTLESRILNASYKAMQGGRFERAWNQLYYRAVDDLQAHIDEHDEIAWARRDDIRLCESRGK